MVTLPCVFRKTHDKVTKTNSINSAFAVRFLPRRTAKSALCRVFFSQTHGKQPSLPCVFLTDARQTTLFAVRFSHRRTVNSPLCRAFFSQAHGKEGYTPFGSGAVSCFCLPCVAKKRTAKNIYRALSDVAHGKDALPCKMLPCALCRAPRRKTHGKGFAVRFWSFAVRSWRTAKPRFPVVSVSVHVSTCTHMIISLTPSCS
jgi:hypothetical protein